MMMSKKTLQNQRNSEPGFELTGGALCLDLVNTVVRRPTGNPQDLLRTYGDLVSWGEQADTVPAAAAAALRREAKRQPAKANSVLSRTKKLREALFEIFAAVVRGAGAPPGALAILNESLPAALSGLRVLPSQRGFKMCREPASGGLECILHPAVASAAELLTSRDLDRVRQCEAESCDWLFLDRSRNRSRRWCDMTVCGNRAKARRHYRRIRKKTS